MANTYTQIYIHIVFSVKWRQPLIEPSWKEEVHRYITGIVQNQGHKLIAINTMPDHIHIFIGQRPDASLSDLVRDIKKDSTNHINQKLRPGTHFAWQEGFGAFSYSHSHIDAVVRYIKNQERRHSAIPFLSEYETMLKSFSVDYDARYLHDRRR